MVDFGLIDKIIAIFFSLGILLNGYLIGKYVRTNLFPSSIFSFFWFGYTFFPLVFLFHVPVNPVSILFILLCTLAFSVSSLFFIWTKAFKRNKQKTHYAINYLSNKLLLRMFYALNIITIISLVIDLYIQGFKILDFIFEFYASSNSFMAKRYNQEIVPNIFSQLANVCNYTLVMLGGILSSSKVRTKFGTIKLVVITLLPSMLITLTQSAKGTILLSLVLFYGGVLISRIFMDKLELTNKKTNKRLIVGGIFLIGIMIISFMSRGLYEESGDMLRERLSYYFYSYSFGHIYAFSDWFSYFVLGMDSMMNYIMPTSPYYGLYTFMYFFRLIGDNTYIPPGVFDEYYFYENLFSTNIYTIFRGNILDFGVIGSLFFWFLTGLVCNAIYYCLLSFKKPVTTIPLFIMMLGFFYTSFIISLLIWKSIFAGIILLGVIMKVNKLNYEKS